MDNCETKKSCGGKMAKVIALCIFVVLMPFAVASVGANISKGLTHFRSYDRFISVKGLATKDVDADLAVWSISFNTAAETLAGAQENLTSNATIVREFLVSSGIAADDIRLQNISVVDRKAQIYGGNGGDMTLRYILSQTLVARTNNIDAMQKASQNISDLIKKGVTLGDPNGGSNQVPQYMFTKLNDVKPELIAEATKNARVSAEQFAKDSGQSVGQMRSAYQGTIQIESRDPGVSESDTPRKSIRVVSTIEYLLGD